LGARRSLGSSNWTYDTEVTHTEERLEKITFVLRKDAIDNFFAPLLGPQLGLDPIFSYYPVFAPNYAAFYKPLTPAQYATFSGYGTSHSNTSDDLFRIQFTNSSLLPLPAGSAAIAVVLEGGYQDWSYRPDVGFTNGEYFEYAAVTGGGHRSRYAGTTEIRLPVLSAVTLTTSGRYDLYSVAGNDVDKLTYNLSIEYQPIESLLVRGRYGTAFKTPTLADEFQGQSGYGISVTDYYQCDLLGYKGTTLGNCPYYLSQYNATTSGNPKLKPITAKVWDIGLAWSPVERFSMTADYIHWAIDNETAVQSADQLLQIEASCRAGTYALNSPSCQAALAQVTRDQFGQIVTINTPKVNVSQEGVNAVTTAVGYTHSLGRLGTLSGKGSWSFLLKHIYQQYPTDPIIDELRDPTYSTDFKTKANASLTWSKDAWSSTVYVAWYGRGPNYLATEYGYGTPDAGTLSPWTLYNLTTHYQITPALAISLAADNLFNAMPPMDHTYPGTTSTPYNSFNYNVYGRSYMIDAKYKFAH
jgi:outer membrane receptor protein involved in Fe transport